MLQGLAYFPGINQLVEASISFTHGISPSVAVVTIAPQLNFAAEGGTLTFSFGSRTVNFPGCKVDASSFERNSQGEIWRLSILDRRWRWNPRWGGGSISGSYNLRHEDGTLKTGGIYANNEQTPQQLATLCLVALGETGFDVSALPNDSRPTVEWDFENPAEALADLVEPLGCRIVLDLDNRVKLHRAGIGGQLPQADILENSLTINPPERPDTLAVVCGANLYQADFELEAVGQDTDGQIKPVDELSYRPSSSAGGWSKADLPYFSILGSSGATTRNYIAELAKKSVWKWYRIKTPLELPGFGTVDSLDQLLPILDVQLETVEENGLKRQKPAEVFGVFFENLNQTRTNSTDALSPNLDTTANGQGGTKANALYRKPYSIDADRGMVIFDDHVFKNTATGAGSSAPSSLTLGNAELRLRTTCTVRDKTTRAIARYVRSRATGGQFGTAARYLKHDEIVLTHLPDYGSSYTGTPSITRNTDEVDREADYYLDAAMQEYQTTLPQSIKYAGLQPIPLDGAIQQVVFAVGSSGTTTTAVRNTELHASTLSYRERRNLERSRRLPQFATSTRGRAGAGGSS